MATVDISLLVSVLSLLIAGIVGISGIRRNRSADFKNETSEMTTLIVKLEYIANGVNEIKSDMRNIQNDVQDLRERLIKVEQSTKQAHQRIDDIMSSKQD